MRGEMMRPVVVVVGNVDGDNLTTIGPAQASFGIFRQLRIDHEL